MSERLPNASRISRSPFAGFDCNRYEKEKARTVMERQQMTWPNWSTNGPGDQGAIAQRYHVTGFPRTFILDAQAIIRFKGLRRERLDQVVDTLLKG